VTSPDDPHGLPVTLPGAQARQVLDLLLSCEHVISALRARGLERDLALAGLEQLAALLTNGGDAAQLAARLEAAQRELAAAMLTREAR
jgi:hypothetical protein